MNNYKRNVMCLVAALAMACGGGVTTHKGMSDLASDAPPPPPSSGDAAAEAPVRKVSSEAKGDFAAAAKAHQKAAQGGWTSDECRSMASQWISLYQSHEKLIEARYNAGVAYGSCNMMKDAEEQFQAALKQNPNHGPSLSNLGTIYFMGGNRDRAKEYWDRAVQADTTLSVTGARANLAWLMIEKIRGGAPLASLEEQVAKNLSQSLAVEFENKEAYVMYALLYLEGAEKNKSRLALANVLLDKAQEIDAAYAPLHNARGLFLLKQENVAEALSSFRRAVELDPKFAEAQLNVGNIVLDFRKYDEAEAAFRAVLGIQPKSYDAMIGLGIAQRGLKKYDEAEASYKKAMKLDGDRPDAVFNLGVLYKAFRADTTEDLRKAQEAYRTATGYFNQAKGKSRASASLKSEADENIKVCEKNVKNLEELIKLGAANPSVPAKNP